MLEKSKQRRIKDWIEKDKAAEQRRQRMIERQDRLRRKLEDVWHRRNVLKARSGYSSPESRIRTPLIQIRTESRIRTRRQRPQSRRPQSRRPESRVQEIAVAASAAHPQSAHLERSSRHFQNQRHPVEETAPGTTTSRLQSTNNSTRHAFSHLHRIRRIPPWTLTKIKLARLELSRRVKQTAVPADSGAD